MAWSASYHPFHILRRKRCETGDGVSNDGCASHLQRATLDMMLAARKVSLRRDHERRILSGEQLGFVEPGLPLTPRLYSAL